MNHPLAAPATPTVPLSFATLQVASAAVGVPEHGRSRFLEPSRAHHGLDSSAFPPQDVAQAEEGGAHGRRGGNGEDLNRVDVFLGTGPRQDRGQEVLIMIYTLFGTWV